MPETELILTIEPPPCRICRAQAAETMKLPSTLTFSICENRPGEVSSIARSAPVPAELTSPQIGPSAAMPSMMPFIAASSVMSPAWVAKPAARA